MFHPVLPYHEHLLRDQRDLAEYPLNQHEQPDGLYRAPSLRSPPRDASRGSRRCQALARGQTNECQNVYKAREGRRYRQEESGEELGLAGR